MRLALHVLSNAIPVVERGYATSEDRQTWAAALDKLATELRHKPDDPIIINGEVHT